MDVKARTREIEWGDCDPAGIVYYPRYFAMFDGNTNWLFEQAGFSKQVARARFGVTGWPMVDTRARFLIPFTFGEQMEIRSRISEWGRSSFKVEHQVFKDGALAMECWETRVWAMKHPSEPGRLQSALIPAEVKEGFEAGVMADKC